MQRRAAAAYVAFFLVVAVGAYAVTAAATAPTVSVDADHELQQNDTVSVGGTEYTVSELSTDDGGAPQATIEWTADNESQTADVSEGDNVTLGDTQYVAHFPDDETLQLTSDRQAYQQEVQQQREFGQYMNALNTIAILSGVAAIILVALAYMPVRR